MSLRLVIGGTRSGKSAHAEALAARLAGSRGGAVRYVGTADERDSGMAERIARHRQQRPAEWETVLAGADLAGVVATGPGAVTLIDGLGVWIAGQDHAVVRRGVAALIAAAESAEVIVVAEQAGDGLLPMDALARDWLDLLGESVQALSVAAVGAQLVVAGRVLELPPVSVPAP